MTQIAACELVIDPDVGGTAMRVPPGGVGVHRDPTPFVTLLGSCVAVCLFDVEAGVGGMNHIVVGEAGGGDTRFGAAAMEILLARMVDAGARAGGLRAKLTGGGLVLPGLADVGAANGRFALEHLRRLRIPVLSADLGGRVGRKVVFEPRSGRLRVKRSPPCRAADLPSSEELPVTSRLERAIVNGGIG